MECTRENLDLAGRWCAGIKREPAGPGSLESVRQLERAVPPCLREHNQESRFFAWAASAARIVKERVPLSYSAGTRTLDAGPGKSWSAPRGLPICPSETEGYTAATGSAEVALVLASTLGAGAVTREPSGGRASSGAGA